jgi:DNA polymerase III delta subunit
MNIQELQKQIIDKQLNNLYVFLGEEIAIQKIYINKIAEIKNLEIQYVEEYKQIHNSLSVNNLFDIKKLYVILDDLDILKQENVWQDIKPNGNIIIFKYNNLDKRNKFYKQFENNMIEFNKLSDEVLTKYIQKEIDLNNIHCKQLIDICGSSFNQILLEIDKIKNYISPAEKQYKRQFEPKDLKFEVLEKQGAFHKEISDITFTFIEKIITRDIKQVYKLQKQLKQIGESNIKLLSLLYNNFKIILLIQSCKSDDISKTTGLKSNEIYFNKDKTGYYSIGELVNALRLIQSTEEGIKTGKIDEEISIDYVLNNIL